MPGSLFWHVLNDTNMSQFGLFGEKMGNKSYLDFGSELITYI